MFPKLGNTLESLQSFPYPDAQELNQSIWGWTGISVFYNSLGDSNESSA